MIANWLGLVLKKLILFRWLMTIPPTPTLPRRVRVMLNLMVVTLPTSYCPIPLSKRTDFQSQGEGGLPTHFLTETGLSAIIHLKKD